MVLKFCSYVEDCLLTEISLGINYKLTTNGFLIKPFLKPL